MGDLAKEITHINIEDELKQSYLDYAMSVIVGRALPDVRDGLKPVHRRVLYAMSELGNDWNKSYKKSARVVGDVVGKYHPHGEIAVYDSIVRMAQHFSMRYLLINGQGNFGSIDGDPPAAMRYTEVRMMKITHMLLSDLDKDTVDFVFNYDESELQPTVLPTRVPNLLVNGSSGIAVGMATNIPPHNLNEVINACLAYINEKDIGIDDLIKYVHGPDFPTAGIINGRKGIIDAYRLGRGIIYIRARSHIEYYEFSNKKSIVVTELPYQVNKARLIEKIAELVKEKKIEGISALRDESDKDGMRIVIDIRKGENAEVIQNNLYNLTQLQNVFGINMVALVEGQPRLLNLKQMIEYFVNHRRQVVSRRTSFELNKARERAHILEGLGIALINIDPVISLIKAASSLQKAKQNLMEKHWYIGEIFDYLDKTDDYNLCRPTLLSEIYGIQDKGYKLSYEQAQAILDLKLHRLTKLEQEKIIEEFYEILSKIKNLLDILSSEERLKEIIREELEQIKTEFSDNRRTEIVTSQINLCIEDLIQQEEMVVTLSNFGYVKSQALSAYQAQRRGGRGKTATSVKDEDFISYLRVANTHDVLLCFSTCGKVYWLKVHQLPVAGRNSRGRPIINLLPLNENERINAVLPIKEFNQKDTIVMATSKGIVKQVALTDFSRPRSNGIIAIDLQDDDRLIGASLVNTDADVLLSSNTGKIIRFSTQDIRCMGRTARGVRGIKLKEGQQVISLIVVNNINPTGCILSATINGFGKRTDINKYSCISRGGQGVIGIQTTKRNGNVVGAIHVETGDGVMLITNKGTLVRIRANEVSKISRNTQGVRLINLAKDEKLVDIQCVTEHMQGENEDER